MIINHQVGIVRSTSTYEWNEELQDNVWKTIRYNVTTFDMDLKHEKTPVVSTPMILFLPPPDPNNFIPFKDVTNSVIIKWINDLVPEYADIQAENTRRLMIKIAPKEAPISANDVTLFNDP